MRMIDELGISPAPWERTHNHPRIVWNGMNLPLVTGINPADARLIAAAPELYACLRRFYELEFPMGYEGVGGEWLNLAKETEKALSKASGEEEEAK